MIPDAYRLPNGDENKELGTTCVTDKKKSWF